MICSYFYVGCVRVRYGLVRLGSVWLGMVRYAILLWMRTDGGEIVQLIGWVGDWWGNVN